MARKTIEVHLDDRGNPLHFRIREMPATKLERWIMKALLLLSAVGAKNSQGKIDITKAGEHILSQGLPALQNLDYDRAQPLLDDLLGCCSRVIGKLEEPCTPASVDNYIEDVATLFALRVEALKLNLGFLAQAEPEENSSACQEQASTATA